MNKVMYPPHTVVITRRTFSSAYYSSNGAILGMYFPFGEHFKSIKDDTKYIGYTSVSDSKVSFVRCFTKTDGVERGIVFFDDLLKCLFEKKPLSVAQFPNISASIIGYKSSKTVYDKCVYELQIFVLDIHDSIKIEISAVYEDNILVDSEILNVVNPKIQFVATTNYLKNEAMGDLGSMEEILYFIEQYIGMNHSELVKINDGMIINTLTGEDQ